MWCVLWEMWEIDLEKGIKKVENEDWRKRTKSTFCWVIVTDHRTYQRLTKSQPSVSKFGPALMLWPTTVDMEPMVLQAECLESRSNSATRWDKVSNLLNLRRWMQFDLFLSKTYYSWPKIVTNLPQVYKYFTYIIIQDRLIHMRITSLTYSSYVPTKHANIIPHLEIGARE